MVELDRLRDGDIRICMFVDHPPPHIHAYQAEHELEVDIKTFSTKGRITNPESTGRDSVVGVG